MTLHFIDDAVKAGAREWKACETLELSLRTVQRWRAGAHEDKRRGPIRPPANKLSAPERAEILKVANTPVYRNLSPKQIVPLLSDEGIYLGSESSVYRILRDAGQLVHREPSRPPTTRKLPKPLSADGPNQVWSWDITYLRTARRGCFFYLYLVLDIWSRKIVAAEVYAEESMELAASFLENTCTSLDLDPRGLYLHSDNGGPMKGSTMLATLERLGIIPSFSRPSVSDDNPYSEALFRTLKYRPSFPRRPFESIEAANSWVTTFVSWYNTVHLHSGIRFVTPALRHEGRDANLLRGRTRVYENARRRHPERWTGPCRNWLPIETVSLNPGRSDSPGTSERQKVA